MAETRRRTEETKEGIRDSFNTNGHKGNVLAHLVK